LTLSLAADTNPNDESMLSNHETFPGTRIRSVSRATAILELIAGDPSGTRATDVAAALELPLPTAYHLLNTLTTEGFLTKREDRRYQLGPKIGLLAEAFSAQVSAPEHLLECIRKLAERSGETAYLSAWRGGEAVVLSVVEGSRAVRVSGIHLGFGGHAHARASGKAMLAFAPPGAVDEYLRTRRLDACTKRTITSEKKLREELEKIRRQGHAIDEEEFVEGVGCVGAPVADGSMAITVSAPVEQFRRRRRELVAAVMAVAAEATIPSVMSATG
jgi:IclR family transcriptional regulator, acetate operon repressor